LFGNHWGKPMIDETIQRFGTKYGLRLNQDFRLTAFRKGSATGFRGMRLAHPFGVLIETDPVACHSKTKSNSQARSLSPCRS
jgi:hypothetical protein